LGFAVGLSGEGGGLECLIGRDALAGAGGDSAGSSGLMSPNGHQERLIYMELDNDETDASVENW